MSLLKFGTFLGEMPIRDVRLLPDQMAAVAENLRVDGGSLKTVNQSTQITALAGTTRRVFRIPTGALDTFTASFWMQFTDEDTAVARTPVVNDSFERYYWCSPTEGMRYNTRARIINGDPSYKLGVVPPATAPTVTPDPATGARKTRTIGGGEFDAAQYLTDNPDVASFISARRSIFAVEHYFFNGRAEGRTRPAVTGTATLDGNGNPIPGTGQFDIEAYYTLYPDVQAAFEAEEISSALDHYVRYGELEGRAFPVVAGTEEDLGFANPMVTRSYVYTYVTIYGEESQPSPPAEGVGAIDQTWTIAVTAPSTISERAPIDKVRIYRTITASSGRTTFFRVTEIAAPVAPAGWTTVHADTQTDTVVSGNLQLESTIWAPPPDGLQGLVAMPNGILAAWKGNTVWFSENFRPHAWPAEYETTVQFPVVGCGVFGNTLVACTTSNPAVISGVRSSTMAMQDNLGALPCTSRRSIVSTQMGVVFASENGLAMVGPSGVAVITDQIIGRYIWQQRYKPYSMRSCIADGGYLGTYTDGGVTKGFLLNLQNPAGGIVHLTDFAFEARVQTDPWSGKPLVVQSSALSELLPSTGTPRYGVWRSKEMQAPMPTNFAVGEVFYDAYTGPALGAGEFVGEIRIFADGRLIYDQPLTASGKEFRLPSGFKAEVWQIELRSRVRIHAANIASTLAELKRG
jgi:hypothetical protein